MSTQEPGAVMTAATDADEALRRLQGILRQIGDGDLHRAHSAGGWSVAQVVSHINVCAVLFLGDVQRLHDDPDLTFLFREEVGHDALGYPPPTVDVAVRQLDSARRSLTRSLPSVPPAVLQRRVEIPDLGTRTVGEWAPLIVGHIVGHVDQAVEILADRGVLPMGAA